MHHSDLARVVVIVLDHVCMHLGKFHFKSTASPHLQGCHLLQRACKIAFSVFNLLLVTSSMGMTSSSFLKARRGG